MLPIPFSSSCLHPFTIMRWTLTLPSGLCTKEKVWNGKQSITFCLKLVSSDFSSKHTCCLLHIIFGSALNIPWISAVWCKCCCWSGSFNQLTSHYDLNSQNLCFTLFFVSKFLLKDNELILAMQSPENDQPNVKIVCVCFFFFLFSMAMTIQILLSLDRVDLARYERKHTSNDAIDLFV